MLQDMKAEKLVLGAMLTGAASAGAALEALRPEYFYYARHRRIFNAIIKLFESSREITPGTVQAELKKSKQLKAAGNAGYVQALADKPAKYNDVKKYAWKIRRKAVFRKMVELGKRLAAAGRTGAGDPAEIIDTYRARLVLAREMAGPAAAIAYPFIPPLFAVDRA
jgi:replicative DNA helicase